MQIRNGNIKKQKHNVDLMQYSLFEGNGAYSNKLSCLKPRGFIWEGTEFQISQHVSKLRVISTMHPATHQTVY